MADVPFQGVVEYLRRTLACEPGIGVSDAQLLDRFVQCADEAAFELLVWRHGKMVMGTCRRLLRDSQDAEDAFQASFLALARRARGISRRESVGAWLYRVATRAALHCRTRVGRQRNREQTLIDQAVPGPEQDPARIAALHEVRPLLDAEVNRLPERFRIPFVLRHLEGWSNREIAGELGCSEGTVESRLTRARQRLRIRLSRRGITLTSGLLAASLCDEAARAAISKSLIMQTARSASLVRSGMAAVAAISPRAIVLTQGVLQAMLVAKLKFIGAMLLALALVGGGAAATAYRSLAGGLNSPEPSLVVDEQPARANDEKKEKQRTDELLAPTRVHLIYRDTHINDAVADFKQKSGYDLAILDLGNRLKTRKITLDTGEVSFWKALALFCEKGEVMDDAASASWARTSGGGFAAAGGFGGGGVGGGGGVTAVAEGGQPVSPIHLSDGVPNPLPAFLDSAVRVRALPSAAGAGSRSGREIVVPLEIVPEPRLRWQRIVGIHVDKAIDDQGQQLVQTAPLNAGAKADAPAGVMFPAANVGGGAQAFVMGPRSDAQSRISLNKGEKKTKVIKELSGKLTASVLSRPDPVMVVSNIMKSIGKSVEVDGAKLEIRDIGYPEEGKISIRFALVTPQAAAGGFAAAAADGFALARPAVGVPVVRPAVPVAPAGVVAPRAVNAAQVLRAGVFPTAATRQEFCLVDEQGAAFPRVGSSASSQAGPEGVTILQEFIFDTSKNKSQPSAFTYSVRKQLTVEVPFMLRDVPVEGQ
jgi:RNA polymerase sigma factor (sigma-70 family)